MSFSNYDIIHVPLKTLERPSEHKAVAVAHVNLGMSCQGGSATSMVMAGKRPSG